MLSLHCQPYIVNESKIKRLKVHFYLFTQPIVLFFFLFFAVHAMQALRNDGGGGGGGGGHWRITKNF